VARAVALDIRSTGAVVRVLTLDRGRAVSWWRSGMMGD